MTATTFWSADGRPMSAAQFLEVLYGALPEFFKDEDELRLIWGAPDTRTALIEQRELVGRFPAPLQPGDGTRLDQYELLPASDERIAGHATQVVLLRPRDNLRYARRLWLERKTGLLVRWDLLNERGDVLESASFSELQLKVKPSPQTLLQEMHQLDGYKVSKPVYTATRLDQEGWTLSTPVPGFEVRKTVRRPMAPGSVRPAPAGGSASGTSGEPGTTMVQAVFSDGLTHVSVFIEPFAAHLHKREAPATIGSTSALSRRSGDWWITAVGAVPVVALQQFVQGLERRKP